MNWKFAAFIVCLMWSGCSTKTSEQPESSQKFDHISDVHLSDLSGAPIDMDQYEGQKVFINVWATWCRPCIQEMPSIAEAMKQLEGYQMVFLFASNESAELITSFKEARKFDFNFVQLQNLESLNITALPTTFIFNPQGELVFSETGIRDWSTDENIQLIKSSQP
jgi:thiol-disulfide isomerase/thioredoxin